MDTEDDGDFDPDRIFPPDKFVKVPGVWVFDTHSRTDGHGKKPKTVDENRLQRMAKVNNSLFKERGVAGALILGHTKEGVDEHEQPKPVGWAVRYRTDKMLADGTVGLKTDWYVKRKYKDVIDEYPFRSIELWPSTDEITHIALLRTASDRPLPPIKYNSDRGEEPDRYLFTPPNSQPTPISPEKDPMATTDDKDKAVAAAQEGESSPVRELMAEVATLKEQLAEVLPVVMQLKELMAQTGGDEDGDDLLGPADDDTDTDDDDDKEPEKPKTKDKAPAKKADDKEPEKFGAGAFAGPTNVFTPTQEKVKMSRETDENLVRYERRIKELEAKEAEFTLKFNRIKAEKKVAELEKDARIDFGTPEDREVEVELFSRLDDASFDVHASRVVKYYKTKPEPKPDSEGVAKALQFSRTGDPKPVFNSTDDILKLTETLTNTTDPRAGYEAYLKSKAGK